MGWKDKEARAFVSCQRFGARQEKEKQSVENILVAYDAGYGTTQTVAEVIATTLAQKHLPADLKRHDESIALTGYDAIFTGSPIRHGRCTPRTRQLLKRNNVALRRLPVAFFFSCISITDLSWAKQTPLYIDPAFANAKNQHPRIGVMRKNHTASYNLDHVLELLPGIEPAGIAFFKGRLEWSKLCLVHKLIMQLAMFAQPEIQTGNFINPVVIRAWTNRMVDRMGSGRTN